MSYSNRLQISSPKTLQPRSHHGAPVPSQWAPRLTPIHGSPSVPQPVEFAEESDIGDAQEYPEEEDHDTVAPSQADVEQGMGPGSRLENAKMAEKTRKRGFVGGFVAGLKNVMAKNNPRPDFINVVGPSGENMVVASPRLSLYQASTPSQSSSRLPPGSPYPDASHPPIEELPIEEEEEDYEEDVEAYANQPGSAPHTHTTTSPEAYDDGTTAVNHGPPLAADYSVMSSPQQISVSEINDYDKAHTPYPFTNPDDDSIQSYVDRVHRFFVDIWLLPWSQSQITSEYIPTVDSSRRDHKRSDRVPPSPWYTPKKRAPKPEIDLIGSPSMSAASPTGTAPIIITTIPPTPTHSANHSYYTTTRSMGAPSDARLTLTASQFSGPSYRSRGVSESGRTAIRPLRSPGTVSTSSEFPSPGASSHGRGQHSMSYSYHYPSPQHTRWIPPNPYSASAMSTPMTRMESAGLYSPSLRG